MHSWRLACIKDIIKLAQQWPQEWKPVLTVATKCDLSSWWHYWLINKCIHSTLSLFYYKRAMVTVTHVTLMSPVLGQSTVTSNRIPKIHRMSQSMKNCQCIMFPFNCQGIARTQSPTTKNCTPEFPTFGGIADFSQAKCNALASTWAACLRDHKQPAPGKLIRGCQLGSYEETVLWKLMVHWKHKHLCGVDVTCLHYSTCMPDSLHIVYI